MIDPTALVLFLNSLEPTWVLLFMVALCLASIALLGRFFGIYGLVSYYVIGTIIGNIQVLKGSKFFFLENPIALGTTIFSTLYLCNTLISNNFSRDLTKKVIYLSGVTFVLFSAFMVLTTGYTPLPSSYGLLSDSHTSMHTLFSNMPSLIIASVLAFVISERFTSITFLALKKTASTLSIKVLSFFSMCVGQLLDSVLFAVLAWKVFAPVSYDWHTIFYTYILGTLFFRLLLSGVFSLCFPFLNKLLIQKT